MEYRDIVNRDIVNLQNCEDEPIHIPGLIQSHGFLIAINPETHFISVCSENIEKLTDVSYVSLLGKKIETIFNSVFLEELNQFKENESQAVASFNLNFQDKIFAISLHRIDNFIIIEAEPTENFYDTQDNLYNSSKTLLSYIEDSFTLQELADAVAIEVKKITDYDRVMIYRFDAMYNGEIIAESKEEHLEPFLGLHYPHTDIPVQARELYLKNHLRIIGDVDYTSVPLMVLDNNTIQSLDLSLSVLRSVSPIHIQYLNNMGVGATLTISLIYKGRLWGLITCHHYSKKYLSQELRNTVKLYGHFITSQIDVRLLNEEYKIAGEANKSVNKLISKKLTFNRNSIGELFKKRPIINLCNSIGVSALIDNNLYKFGKTPTNPDIKKLSEILVDQKVDNHFHTHTLSRKVSGVSSISDTFPGINYYYLGYGIDCMIWYRAQTIEDIHWAGDPKKAIEKDSNGLSPRKSFAKFKEVVQDSSKPWLKSEIKASSNFINYFLAHLRSITINEEKENQKNLTEALKDVNSELENLNWISTHDLQEPLRKIRMMASMINDADMDQLPEGVQIKILKMQSSAERMQTLIKDILSYSKAGSQEGDLHPLELNGLLEDVKNDLHDTLKENDVKIIIDELPEINGIKFLLKQLFLNIIYNSIKFKQQNNIAEISIRHIPIFKSDVANSKKYYRIDIEDNGIGFENEYNKKIFKIFSRLHDKTDYSGSGIGLALCKKIMTKHNGLISANGILDKGTIISLYFPKG